MAAYEIVKGESMKFIDFFSGIGGFRLGLEMAGHECAGHCEIDRFANKSYMAMHDVKEGEWFADDIRRVEPGELPEADCWCGGFPCQSFSIAGKRGGFEDMRGTLIFEIFRLAAERKPEIIFLENVAGLLNHDGGRTFGAILNGFWQLGYDVQWSLLNSKNFGVPHNRERVFIVGCFGKGSRRKIFPITRTSRKALKQIGSLQLEGRHESACRVYGVDGLSPCLNTCGGGGLEPKILLEQNFIDLTKGNAKITENARALQARYNKGFSTRNGETSGVIGIYQKPRGYNEGGLKDVAPTLTKNSYEQNNLVVEKNDEVLIYDDTKSKEFGGGKYYNICPTLRSSRHGHKVIEQNNPRIRRLTPRECFRLQGFPDEYFERAAKVNSNSQLYKQAGNAVSVPVIYEIARRL